MADPDTYIFVTCAECKTLILKPQKTLNSTLTASSYRSPIEAPTATRHTADDTSAVCSQCRQKTALSAKDPPK